MLCNKIKNESGRTVTGVRETKSMAAGCCANNIQNLWYIRQSNICYGDERFEEGFLPFSLSQASLHPREYQICPFFRLPDRWHVSLASRELVYNRVYDRVILNIIQIITSRHTAQYRQAGSYFVNIWESLVICNVCNLQVEGKVVGHFVKSIANSRVCHRRAFHQSILTRFFTSHRLFRVNPPPWHSMFQPD